jgi:hypothetical protein
MQDIDLLRRIIFSQYEKQYFAMRNHTRKYLINIIKINVLYKILKISKVLYKT